MKIRLSRGARSLPIVTGAVFVLTALITGLQLVDPRILTLLQRNPEAIAAGQWWRLVTSLFVHDGGWTQILFNLISLAVIGSAVERLFGGGRWLLLYFSAGLAGELIGLAWQPEGAGNSVACAGLVGAVLVTLVRRAVPVPSIPTLYALCWVGALTGEAVGGPVGAIVLGVVLGSQLSVLLRQVNHRPAISQFLGIVGLAGAIILALLHDIHGPPIILGACLAAFVTR